MLEMYNFSNETLAAKETSRSSLLWWTRPIHAAQSTSKLQDLHAQLTEVQVRQESLCQQVENFTRNAGLASSSLGWDISEMLVFMNLFPWQEGIPGSSLVCDWGQGNGRESCEMDMKLGERCCRTQTRGKATVRSLGTRESKTRKPKALSKERVASPMMRL